MWFVAKVNFGKERESRDLLLDKEKFDNVEQVYVVPRRVHTKQGKDNSCQRVMEGYVFLKLKINEHVAIKEEQKISLDDGTTRNVKVTIGERKPTSSDIWNEIKSYVSPWGYFFYHIDVVNPSTQETFRAKKKTHIHFLSSNPKTTTPSAFIDQAHIPDEAMESYMAYNNSVLSEQAEAIIVNESFSAIAKDKDIVRVTNGPLAGVSGVIRQENQGNGMRDRRLIASFGKSLIVKYPNIRRYNMVVVREAVTGKNSQEPQSWRIMDRLVALIQNHYRTRDPYKRLRRWLSAINYYSVGNVSSKMSVAKRVIKDNFANASQYRRLLYALSTLFPKRRDENFEHYLSEYIPSMPIRPFLTPAYDDLSVKDRTKPSVNKHAWLTEVIVPVNLCDLFNLDLKDAKQKADLDKEDYEYDAHVAIVKADNQRKAIVSWGGFYDKYESLTEVEKNTFREDLRTKGYTKFSDLLDKCSKADNEDSKDKDECKGKRNNKKKEQTIRFEKIEGIGGFSLPITGRHKEDTAVRLVDEIAPATVEFWQGTRLMSWRRLLQQYVLIHKVPKNFN